MKFTLRHIGRLLTAFTLASTCAQAQEIQDSKHMYVYVPTTGYTSSSEEWKPQANVFWVYKFNGFPPTMDLNGEHQNLKLRNHIFDHNSGDCIPVYSYEGNIRDHYDNGYQYVPYILSDPLANQGNVMSITELKEILTKENLDDLEDRIALGLEVNSSQNSAIYFLETKFINGDDKIYTQSPAEIGTFHGLSYEDLWETIKKSEENRQSDIAPNKEECHPANLMDSIEMGNVGRVVPYRL